MPAGWVHPMSNRPNGTLYLDLGITGDPDAVAAAEAAVAAQGKAKG